MCDLTIKELNDRKHDSCLISITVLPAKIFIKERDGISKEKDIYVFTACNISGKRKYITTVFKDKYSKTADWYNFLLTLKNKGIDVILFALIPDDDNLSRALKLAFSNINIVISYYETINKLTKYYTESYSNGLYYDIKNIYLSENLDLYNLSVNNFKEKYCTYSFISDVFEKDLKRAKTYYKYDYEIRQFVFSYYHHRDLAKKIRLISNSNSQFNSIDEFVTELIPFIKSTESRIWCSKATLTSVINKLYENYKDLIKSYL